LFSDLWQDEKGNPKPEHEWPSENFWRYYPRLDPGQFAESEDEREPGSSD